MDFLLYSQKCKKLKLISFVITIFTEFLLIVGLQLLDSFDLILLIFTCCAISGLLITLKYQKKSKMQEMGWGLLFGSLTSIILTISFTIWLSYNFPQ